MTILSIHSLFLLVVMLEHVLETLYRRKLNQSLTVHETVRLAQIIPENATRASVIRAIAMILHQGLAIVSDFISSSKSSNTETIM